jgi:hypothetical protein
VNTALPAAVLAAVVSATVALVVGVMNYLHNRRTLKEARNAERRKAIVASLNEFYGPMLSYINVAKALHKILVSGKPSEFRTLTFLLDPKQEFTTEAGISTRVSLSEADTKLLAEIVEVKRKIEDLIINKAGYIQDNFLMNNYVPNASVTDVSTAAVTDMGLLALAITHFRVLRLAFEGALRGEVERYRDFVYPRELNAKLEEQVNTLRRELRELGG